MNQLSPPPPDTNIIELECYKSPASDTARNFMFSYYFTNTKSQILGYYVYNSTPYYKDEPVVYLWGQGTALFKDSVIKRTSDYLIVPLNPALNEKIIFKAEGYSFYGKKNNWIRLWIASADSIASSSKILAAYDYYIRKPGYYYSRIR